MIYVRRKDESCLLLFSLFLKLREDGVRENLHRSLWCSFESFLSLDEHREDECHISVIDSDWHSWDVERFDETHDILEEFLIDTDDEVELTNTSFLSELIEFHSAITKAWIIVGIANLKFD
jgi:hypothetical protein